MIRNGEFLIETREASMISGLSVQTIRMLARTAKLPFFTSDSRSPRKLWFREGDLETLIEAYTLRRADGTGVLSAAIRSRRIAREKKYSAGKLITKSDAAFLLEYSRRGIEYHVEAGHLRSITLGHRTTALLRRDVIAWQRKRMRWGRRTGSKNTIDDFRRRLRGLPPAKKDLTQYVRTGAL